MKTEGNSAVVDKLFEFFFLFEMAVFSLISTFSNCGLFVAAFPTYLSIFSASFFLVNCKYLNLLAFSSISILEVVLFCWLWLLSLICVFPFFSSSKGEGITLLSSEHQPSGSNVSFPLATSAFNFSKFSISAFFSTLLRAYIWALSCGDFILSCSFGSTSLITGTFTTVSFDLLSLTRDFETSFCKKFPPISGRNCFDRLVFSSTTTS
mmetsp:Transcript_3106/g.3249  ORF Transcript_3106/g.3249 Transcript_3106/m.3249 type:complete len:208 (+) Transcript_3106:103-726(+)